MWGFLHILYTNIKSWSKQKHDAFRDKMQWRQRVYFNNYQASKELFSTADKVTKSSLCDHSEKYTHIKLHS